MHGALVLMGSGETSPTMVEIHRGVIGELGPKPRAVLLDTPYAFQENAADISNRARQYFARSVGVEVEVNGVVTGADWVFCGPGSPTYALDRWSGSSVPADLRARIRAARGVTVFASAAACTAGAATVPVYEIYKVGAEPHWREGLDLLAVIGLDAVVIPHYDNAEGGTHDTRFCYLGERRLSRMERELPAGTGVLGIDEHTALLIDLVDERVRVAGRGGVTVRTREGQSVLPAGSGATLDELRVLLRGEARLGEPAPVPRAAPQETLSELVEASERSFASALGSDDVSAATRALLRLEEDIAGWSADTEQDDGGPEQAREVLRRLIAALGTHTAGQALARLVPPLLAVREKLRCEGAYGQADLLREALVEGGVRVEDTPEGPRWSIDG
ncbi:hypothetical protein [Nonomuraea soli]|uniref:Cysteinyl-tRNA synthetase n=1 Tax=Nonomuraea soli TaxID=1032476 RepID=A0A7W0CIY8_9ACTN|nr:hypothetical protein [Nonomuraea soli]MBA2892020.1 hypothetical protein [Nonomuraea soli]